MIPIGLHPHQRWLMQTFLQGVTEGIANAGTKPAIQSLKQLLHGVLHRGIHPSLTRHKKKEPVFLPVPLRPNPGGLG